MTANAKPGLDWTTEFAPGEWEKIEQGYIALLGEDKVKQLVHFVPFFHENRPDALKRWRLYVRTAAHGDGLANPYPWSVSPVVMMQFSCTYRYAEGVLSDLWEMRRIGGSKQQLQDMLAMSWVQAGPAGMNMAAHLLDDELRQWDDSDAPGLEWPENWAPDPTAFSSGVDFAAAGDANEISAEDLEKIESWYIRVQGEVPEYVGFFAKYYPLALKVFRARYETLNTGSLPPQVIAVAHVHLAAQLCKPDALRRALHMARYFGVPRDYVIQVLSLTNMYLGDLGQDDGLVGVAEILDKW